MSNKPTHTAYVVIDAKEGSDRKAQWHEIGAIWPHKNGKGFDLAQLAGSLIFGQRREHPGNL